MASTSEAFNVVVLISGSGTNLQALINGLPTFRNPTARISLVVSNSKFAFGLQRAQSADPTIPTQIFSLASFRKQHPNLINENEIRAQYDRELAEIVKLGKPRLVVLAGFMHILSEEFLKKMQANWDSGDGSSIPVINLHPALPGQFDGANAIQRAWEAGPDGTAQVCETGVMIHEVIPEVDRGKPILVRKVELKRDESLEALQQRIHQVEHELIVEGVIEVLRRIASTDHS
ncbi:hypothetical protein O181_044602 [Austropuccinia psidii MF-1]|uniref:Phosphoribosylglycinamide formyltransferase n=1 Tax=Austropuccinia psidii MF-1 TaxID=1389203 RepID=A0A9Q3DS50_9BASI|nr:hypothetical protein [Austropuccinia psidii MF-1]